MEQTLLTPQHQQILAAISSSKYLTDTFYFTGGTALSEFYFHHRYSEDLDFFSQTEIDFRQLDIEINKIISTCKPNNVERQTLNGQQIYWFIFKKQTIKTDFAYYPFEPLGEFIRLGNLKVSSLEDLAVNKLQAMMTRKRGRDYLDYYFISRKINLSPTELAKLYRLKFDMSVRPEEIAKHFAGVLDAIDQPIFLGGVPWETIVDYFIAQTKKIKTEVVK